MTLQPPIEPRGRKETDGAPMHTVNRLRELDNAKTGGKRDIFQEIVWEHMDGSGTEQFDGINPNYLADAVEIAAVRGKMEDAIFKQPILPMQQWLGEYKKLMLSHPRMRPYGHVFNNVFWSASKDHMDTMAVWGDAHKAADQQVSNDMYAEANPQVATELCKTVMEFTPTDQPKAFHGALAVRVVLSDNDFAAYAKGKHGAKNPTTAGIYYEKDKRAPLFVVSESSLQNFRQITVVSYVITRHMEGLFEQAVTNCNPDLLPSQVVNNLAKVFADPYGGFTEDLFAYASVLEFTDPQKATKKRIREILVDLGEDMVESRLKKVEKGGLTEEQINVAKNSVQTLADAYDFFRDYFPDLNAGRMARNVLSQFPVKEWKLVVEMLRKRQAQLHPDVQPAPEPIIYDKIPDDVPAYLPEQEGAKPFAEVFPEINQRRVITLMNDDIFVAYASYQQLKDEIANMTQAGQDVSRLQTMINHMETITHFGFTKDLWDEGYTEDEIGAALSVAHGTTKRPVNPEN